MLVITAFPIIPRKINCHHLTPQVYHRLPLLPFSAVYKDYYHKQIKDYHVIKKSNLKKYHNKITVLFVTNKNNCQHVTPQVYQDYLFYRFQLFYWKMLDCCWNCHHCLQDADKVRSRCHRMKAENRPKSFFS